MEGGCTKMMDCKLQSLGCSYRQLNMAGGGASVMLPFPKNNLFSFSTQTQLHLTADMILDNLKCIFCKKCIL